MIALLVSASLLGPVTLAEPPRATLQAISTHIEAWDLPAARAELAPLEPDYADDPDVVFLHGRVSFYEGRYDDAVTQLEAVAAAMPGDKQVASALALYRSTRDVTQGFSRVPSSRGRFVFVFAPGPDEVLLPYLDEAMEAAADTLGEAFAHVPSEPVRIEILARPEQLASVSPLKPSEIRTTGTIALCKYNRLIAVSPRALVYGYPWLDAVVHEYVHYLVTQLSRNNVPVWLHEGIAKYYESRWREKPPHRLNRLSEDLLARGLSEKNLVPFDAMSPSLAKLPTAEEAALAYAQVFTVIGLLYEHGGDALIRKLLAAMRNGLPDRKAVELVSGKSFARFEREWKNTLFGMNLRRLPIHQGSRMLFRDSTKPSEELDSVGESEARDLADIADRLAVKERFRAAAIEYQKALTKAGGPDPLISARLASMLLKLGQQGDVSGVVTPALELNSDHILLHLYRGKARLALGDPDGARSDFERAIRLNPFDPEVHGLLADALSRLGDTDAAAAERRQQRLLLPDANVDPKPTPP
ncbi:MAG: tetratricopeptide repeat protein [Myxococcales bacterium]|nr:tetratricopeptide repeat protein [Myxococcales bacterium]